MRFEFKLPDLAEGMVEGEVVNWLVELGQAVEAEQPVVEMMTDKATVVISSPHGGSVLELAFQAGDIAPVGDTLFVLEVEGAIEAPAAPEPALKAAPTASAPTAAPAAPAPAVAAASAPGVPRGAGKTLATPATRRMAREMGVNIGLVNGTGPAGRVTKDDLRGYASGPSAAPVAVAAGSAPPASVPAAIPAFKVRTPVAEESEDRQRLRGLRRAIHDAMARSKSTAAHFTYVDDVDCTNLVAARSRLKPVAESMGIRLNYLPFIAKAALLAMNTHTKMNASMDDEAGEIVTKHHRHLGIAAATDGGLTVPTIKHADRLTLLELAASINDLGNKARTNTLAPHEIGGSTFTITSLGKLGGMFATPIINYPEVAILGIHRMEPRAVVRDGEIVARQMMNISLSFDHRIIDGHEGAAFAEHIKRYLEDPELMLLEMI
jgi:pyruvate dehydrogenase E2 component (dihydrolipoamide acetyltransferase)